MKWSLETTNAGRVPGVIEREAKSVKLSTWSYNPSCENWRVGLARTRPLAEPLSPRGPQPVIDKLREGLVWLNGPSEPKNRVLGLWYPTGKPRCTLIDLSCLISIKYGCVSRQYALARSVNATQKAAQMPRRRDKGNRREFQRKPVDR